MRSTKPGFTRLGAALADATPGLPQPIYRFMFSDEFAWGFPTQERYLDAHLALLDARPTRTGWSPGSASTSGHWSRRQWRAAVMSASASKTRRGGRR